MAPVRVSRGPAGEGEREPSPIRKGSSEPDSSHSGSGVPGSAVTESDKKRQERAQELPAASSGSVKNTTLVYVHGMGAQEAAPLLKRRFDEALFGRDVGERTRIAYWADILHIEESRGDAKSSRSQGEATAFDDVSTKVEALFDTKGKDSQAAARWTETMFDALKNSIVAADDKNVAAAWKEMSDEPFNARVIPPTTTRRQMMNSFASQAIREGAAYLFHKDIHERINARLSDHLVAEETGKSSDHVHQYVLVTHGIGSVIAYNVLHSFGDTLSVPLWITLGSPLGIKAVRDHIRKPLQVPRCVKVWVNFADRLDPWAYDPVLASHYTPANKVSDWLIVNLETPKLTGFNPHSSTGYIGHSEVKSTVHEQVGMAFSEPRGSFVIARDLAAELGGAPHRMPVLIQLEEQSETEDLGQRRDTLHDEIKRITKGVAEAELDKLRRFVAAKLTTNEIAELRHRYEELQISRVWKNGEKRALLDVSAHRIQAYTAKLGYNASGKGVHWAVLDTGINASHPHFKRYNNIAATWNCTVPGEPVQDGASDGTGHGTHVAGIIAGAEDTDSDPADRGRYDGIAPQAKLHIYKVLDNAGRGQDSWIIKALDHIAETNEKSPQLKIHGVNLSLGGPFDADVYGCGHSPVCRELRRLWRMGVVACVAAGNEGVLTVQSFGASGPQRQQLTVDLSIGDPANLEEAIAVGSINKEFPHTYGVSYFSSRGPTADGRVKPDLVAPGEQINSCNARFTPNQPTSYYIPMSGTSMACPHVSGLLASFLSVRGEFIGRPDEVKRFVLEHATDLGRAEYHQGHGMPNLVKMLAET